MRKLILRARRFFGLDLPARRLDLRFDLNPPNRRGGKDAMGERELARTLHSVEKEPEPYLHLLLKRIQVQNSRAMAPAKRLARSAVALRRFYPVALQCIHRFSKQGGIPDDPERQQLLDLVSAIARSLASSYKIVFQGDYDASRFRYARHRDRITLCAFRILELIRLEQRSRGLRYQPLPPRAWRDANTLFQIMLAYESVEFPMPLLDSQLRDRKPLRTGSLHELYAAIHTFALLDYSTWPVEQQAFIDSYRESVDQAVAIGEDLGGNLGQDLYIAHCYQETPLRSRRLQGKAGPAVIINCSILAQSIKRDHRELMLAKAQNNRFLVPKTLSGLKGAYQLAISDLMYRNVQREVWGGAPDQAGIPIREFRMYVGFKEIYLHLRGIFSNNPAHQDGRQLANALAERSAKFGEDQTATRESLWYVLHQDKRRILMKTQETRFTTQMEVGSLVAYGARKNDIRRPRLGFISRIFRPQTGVAIVEMERLASYSEPVKLTKLSAGTGPAPTAKAPRMLAFLVCDREFGWGLLLPKQNLIWERSPVGIRREAQRLELELGRVRNLTPQFTLFGLPREITGLGSPEYPADYQKPAPVSDEPELPTVLEFPSR